MRALPRGLVVVSLLAILAAVLSFAKFQHCRSNGWGSPDVYVHMCYSDLSALYGAREINVDKWPYSSPDNSVEYPVITGLAMWGTGLLVGDVNGYRTFFDINALILALLFVAGAAMLWRIRPEFAHLLPAAPAVIASLYINWDLWAVIGSLVAIYLFKVERYEYSALALGIAIATKFFPITILLPVLLHLVTQKRFRALIKYFLITALSWVAVNLPIALGNFEGWSRFYRLNLKRENDLGSIWYALNLLGIDIKVGTVLTLALLLIGVAFISQAFMKMARDSAFDNFAIVAFLAVALFVTISKVYSPQYVLWLTPIALIAMTQREQRSAFWIWQGGEAIYHLAIWQYLASYTGAKFGLPEDLYALSILVRVATLAWFAAALLRVYPQQLARISR